MFVMLVYVLILVPLILAEVSAFQGAHMGRMGSDRRHLLREKTELGTSRRGLSDTALKFRRDPEVGARELLQREKQAGDGVIVPNELVIREAKRNEIASVVSLRVNVFYPELRTMAQFHQRILDKLCTRILRRGSVCLAAFRDADSATEQGKAGARDMFGNILGTIEVSHNDFKGTAMESVGSSRKLYCCDLAVQPKVRRQGLATKLLRAVEEYAFARGYDELYLHVEKSNAAAEKLYLREGYQVIPSLSWAVEFTEGHLQKGYDNYVFLWKRIDANFGEDSSESGQEANSDDEEMPMIASRSPEVALLE